ncbi:MAG: hypothetical protein ACR2P4_10745 [Gammaproteobacteria bacterium]
MPRAMAMSPLQGFYNAPLFAAMVWEIPAFTGMTRFCRIPACAGMTNLIA